MSPKSERGRFHKGRESVFLVVLPEDYKPQRPWDVPDGFTAAELFIKNVAMSQARSFCRLYNWRQIQRGLPDRRWAIVSRHLRAGVPDNQPPAFDPNHEIPELAR
jgi:hypothetical protein